VAVLAGAVLPVALVASPAEAAWSVAKDKQHRWVEGTLESVDLAARTIVLTDGRVLRYDDNDLLDTFQLHDVLDDGEIGCDLRDSGGEASAARFAAKDMQVAVTATVYRSPRQSSVFQLQADTCDGVLTAADAP